MNIWYMHHYSGSKNEFKYGRPYFLAEAFKCIGVNCRIISASYHHLMRFPQDQKAPVEHLNDSGINYSWIKTPKYVGNGFGRLINMLSFAVRLRFTNLVKKYNYERPDVIIVSSGHPLHFIAGKYWAKKFGAKLIFEVRDLWPLSLIENLNVSSYHPLCLLFSMIEKRAYNKSDFVVSLLPNAYEYMKTRGLIENKYCYIPNGISISEKEQSVECRFEKKLKEIKSKGDFIVMYTGAHGVPNSLDILLKVAKNLQDENIDKVQFVLIGDGVRKKELIRKSNENTLSNIHFLDPIPNNEIQSALKFANLAYIGGQNLPIYHYGVSPNKMFEYMFAEKPMIMLMTCPNNPLDVSQSGSCLLDNSYENLANEILKYYNMDSEEINAMGKRGKSFLLNNHTYNVLAKKYLDLIKS